MRKLTCAMLRLTLVLLQESRTHNIRSHTCDSRSSVPPDGGSNSEISESGHALVSQHPGVCLTVHDFCNMNPLRLINQHFRNLTRVDSNSDQVGQTMLRVLQLMGRKRSPVAL